MAGFTPGNRHGRTTHGNTASNAFWFPRRPRSPIVRASQETQTKPFPASVPATASPGMPFVGAWKSGMDSAPPSSREAVLDSSRLALLGPQYILGLVRAAPLSRAIGQISTFLKISLYCQNATELDASEPCHASLYSRNTNALHVWDNAGLGDIVDRNASDIDWSTLQIVVDYSPNTCYTLDAYVTCQCLCPHIDACSAHIDTGCGTS